MQSLAAQDTAALEEGAGRAAASVLNGAEARGLAKRRRRAKQREVIPRFFPFIFGSAYTHMAFSVLEPGQAQARSQVARGGQPLAYHSFTGPCMLLPSATSRPEPVQFRSYNVIRRMCMHAFTELWRLGAWPKAPKAKSQAMRCDHLFTGPCICFPLFAWMPLFAVSWPWPV